MANATPILSTRDFRRQLSPTAHPTFPVMVKVEPCRRNPEHAQEIILITTREKYDSLRDQLTDIFRGGNKQGGRKTPNIGKVWTVQTIKNLVVQWNSSVLCDTILHPGNIQGALTLMKARGCVDVIRIDLMEVSPEDKKRR
ncbi:MAG: hypothetical protein M1835_006291 [Candelina submexicana]|nr:MAG: hypothetical protein M1835_006291 [Candelina submexicana]